jgi:hypothetical protein
LSGPYAGRRIDLTTLHGKERALTRPVVLGLAASLELSACDINALGTFSGEVGRPAHGVLARPATVDAGPWHKDLLDSAALHDALASCRLRDPHGRVWLETDMRAHRNPTRMRSIRRLGVALVRRLATPCPACAAPGWGLVDTEAGLPCGWCGAATTLTVIEVWGCQGCGHRQRRPRRDGLKQADPGQCHHCNP